MTRPVWYWNSTPTPWLIATTESNLIWTAYSDIESDMIEDAYTKKEQQVIINHYIIDLKHLLQIDTDDKTKQRQVQRLIEDIQQQCLRKERFFLTEMPEEPFAGESYAGSTFIDNWRFSFEKNNVTDILEAAAKGVLEEGEKIGKVSEAKWIAGKLGDIISAEWKWIDLDHFLSCKGAVCFYLYSRESFLYKLINKTLRERDLTKVSTLGPFCFLLNSSLFYQVEIHRGRYFRGTVYRGANLSLEMIDLYHKHKGAYRKWLAFTSTSQNRALAETFGNTLFIIDTTKTYDKKYCAAISIANVSCFPVEEEVLLPAGVPFKIDDVQYSDDTKKHIIYLTTGAPN